MSKEDRLRRVVIVCRDFARNLAYLHTGKRTEYSHLFANANRAASFWRVARTNWLDMCVLEWCKLFGDKKAMHYWGNVVSNPTAFEASLLNHLELNEAAFHEEITCMRHYRDKFLAHLDSEDKMNIPRLDVARRAVWFYHAHIVSQEAKACTLRKLPKELDTGYKQCEEEACFVFQTCTAGSRLTTGRGT
jgi:hypothetical protein